MGDRSNVVIMGNGTEAGIRIYTHSFGSDLPKMVQKALKLAKPRWDDTAYFTRMVFDNLLVQAGDHGSEYGWGLYPYTGENDLYEEEHDTIYLTTGSKTVKIGKFAWSFENYLKQEL